MDAHTPHSRTVRLRVLPNGFRVPCVKTVRFPYASKLGQAALLYADAMHIHWLSTHAGMASFRVDSVGVRFLRECVA